MRVPSSSMARTSHVRRCGRAPTKGSAAPSRITRLFKSMTVLDNLVAPLEKTSVRGTGGGTLFG